MSRNELQRVLIVYGTRPEAIKMAPVVESLRRRPRRFAVTVCTTGQHRAMVDQVEAILELRPDIDLDLMRPDQSLNELASRCFTAVDRVLENLAPDWLLVQGDTTTALVAAQVAFHRTVRLGHVEAGLRTGDLKHPFPEEANRRGIDLVADVLFAPTQRAYEALLAEGKSKDQVHLTGNTGVDALARIAGLLPPEASDRSDETALREVLVTVHRRESFGEALQEVLAAVRELAGNFPEVRWVWPVHPNPHVSQQVHRQLGGLLNVELHPPFDYPELIRRLRRCRLVLTDSGGLQEEAPSFGRPVLVLREKTERPEGIEAGVARLVGTDRRRIVRETTRLLSDAKHWRRMSARSNPYGDGLASERIAAILAGEPWQAWAPPEREREGISRQRATRPSARPSTDDSLATLRAESARLAEVGEDQRRRLAEIEGSRLWRLGHLYWSLLRRLSGRADSNAPGPQRIDERPLATTSAERRLPAGFPPLPSGHRDFLVFSIIDWDFRFQRPQQLATQFARHGHRVFYLSTTRFVDLDAAAWELTSKAERVAELAISCRPLDIYSGRLEPGDIDHLEEVFADLLEHCALADVVCWVQIPFWTPLVERLRDRFGWQVVYDCMDEWTNFPGIGERVLELEARLVERADLTVVSSERLQQKFVASAAHLALVRNGVDLDHYDRLYPLAPRDEARHPVIGYFGALASWVDIDLLARIADRFPDATLVLAGGFFDVDLSALRARPNVRLLGQRPYDEMPGLLWSFDVCIIPFLVNRITEATNPVKLYEYFYSGKPVVAPLLSELTPHRECCYLTEGHDEFLAAIETALGEAHDSRLRLARRETARANSWKKRYDDLSAALAEVEPTVSVVIVAHGGRELTRRCLRSLLGHETWPHLEVLIVDNSSPDDTRDYLATLTDPRLRVLHAGRNLGFPAANNLALGAATGEVVVLLNNDTVVPPGLIGRLVRAVSDPDVGLACATTNFCGNEARVEIDYPALGGMPFFAARRARQHAGEVADLAVAAMYCVAARRQVLDEIGPLDEGFGIGMFEDDDYSIRVQAAGYRVICVEDAFVHHEGQASFKTLEEPVFQALWRDNQARFESKWGRPWQPHVQRAGVTTPLFQLERAADWERAWPFDGADDGSR